MNSVKTKNGEGRKIDSSATCGIGREIKSPKFDADRLFTTISGFVPLDEQKAFAEWLNTHQRAWTNLTKGLLTFGELSAAYQQYLKEKKPSTVVKETALSVIDPQQFSAMVSVSQEKVEGLLQVYNPEYLKSLAVLSQRCESDFDTTVEVDKALLNDGSYINRYEETKEVVLAYEELKKAMNSALRTAASLAAKRKHDVPLDKLWDELLKEFEGDEIKAAEVYAKEAERRLSGIDTEPFKPVELDKQLVVEIFKLLNYDPNDLDDFVQYAKDNIKITSSEEAEEALIAVLAEFHDEREDIILNENSSLYKRVAGERIKTETAALEEQAQGEESDQSAEESPEEDEDADEEFDSEDQDED